MIWNSYFIFQRISFLKIGADLQRQVKYAFCSIKAENGEQTFALTDKARRTERRPLMCFFYQVGKWCRTLRETPVRCQFDIITFLQRQKLIFTKTQAITVFFFLRLIEPAGKTICLRVDALVSYISELLVCLHYWRISSYFFVINQTYCAIQISGAMITVQGVSETEADSKRVGWI